MKFTDIRRLSLLLCLIIGMVGQLYSKSLSGQSKTSRQIIVQKIEEKEAETDVLKGDYHIINSEKSSPIEEFMKKSNYCEIGEEYMLIPNCATELSEDGTMPIDEIPIGKLYSLLNKDVLEYYNWLKEEYNTSLKVKRYKESADYKYQVSEIQQEANCALGTTYYLIRSISSDENYDLDSRSFTIQLPNALCGYDLYLKREDSHFKTNDFTTTPIDEDTAYKIETNPCNIYIFVRLTGETRIHGVSKQSICEPTKVIIADNNNGEIFYEYEPLSKPLQTPPNKGKTVSNNQTKSNNEKNPTETVHNCVEVMPEFPGGQDALFKFISKNLTYPKAAAKNEIQGRVIVQFIVEKDGTIGNIRIYKGISPELDKEAIRVFSLPTMPKWKPGTSDGEPVRVRYSVPITFRLN